MRIFWWQKLYSLSFDGRLTFFESLVSIYCSIAYKADQNNWVSSLKSGNVYGNRPIRTMVIRIFFTDDTANTEVYCFKNKNPNSTLSFPKTDWYKYGIWLTAWVFIPAESSHTRRIRRGGGCHKKTIKIVLLGLGTIVTLNYCLTKLTRNAWESGISIYRSPAPLLWKKVGKEGESSPATNPRLRLWVCSGFPENIVEYFSILIHTFGNTPWVTPGTCRYMKHSRRVRLRGCLSGT